MRYLGIVVLGFLCPSLASAATTAQACIEAHAEGQVARKERRLLQASSYFLNCAAETCPDLIRRDCVDFHAAVEAALPSVVLSVNGLSDSEAAGLRYAVDGRVAATTLDGTAIALDPGAHEFSFWLPDGTRRTARTLLNESEKYRKLTVEFGSERTSQSRSVNPLPWALLGFGALGVSGFTYFGLEGRAAEKQLRRCAPNCDADDVSYMRSRYLIADISLGTAVASVAAATYLWLSATPGSRPQTQSRFAWSIAASPSQVAIVAGKRF